MPSDHKQIDSNLLSTPSYTLPHVHINDSTHASWQYKDFFLSVKSSEYDRKWHALVRDGHRSTTNLLPLSGFYTTKLRPLQTCFWFSWSHLPANTGSLLGQSLKHAQNLSVGKPDLRTHLWARPGEIRVKYWQARAFCGELWAAKFVPRNLPTSLARKGVTRALICLAQVM